LKFGYWLVVLPLPHIPDLPGAALNFTFEKTPYVKVYLYVFVFPAWLHIREAIA
jgi:hypothetical protein